MQLVLDNINFSYGKSILFKDASYIFESGKIYGLLGNNGIGKTTLFNIITNILNYNGRITLDGKLIDINHISYIRSIPNLPEFMTGEEYIKYFLKLNSKNIQNKKNVDAYFKELGIPLEKKDVLLKDYSHGMKQKIELLITIILDTDIILLDEPLTNLDLVAREEFKGILNTIKKNKIIIISTHMLELCNSLCDEIVIINDKRLKQVDNNKSEILKNLKDKDDKKNS